MLKWSTPVALESLFYTFLSMLTTRLVASYGAGAVAAVDDAGLVTAVAEGKAKITVTCTNKKKATLTIKVVDPYKPTGVTLLQGKSVTMRVGQTLQLTARLAPITAQSPLTWRSGWTRVAVVSGDGLVTAVRPGRATITVKTRNGKKAKIRVYVVY